MNLKKAEKKRLKKARKKNKRIYRGFQFVAIIFIFATLYFFYRTVISIFLLMAIMLAVGLIVSYFDYKRYFFTFKLESWFAFVRVVFYHSLFTGSFITMLFLVSNYHLATPSDKVVEYEIIDRHSVRGRKYHRDEKKPVFTIRIDGREKEFEYEHKYHADMNLFKRISFRTSVGFWGYTILEGNTLIK